MYLLPVITTVKYLVSMLFFLFCSACFHNLFVYHLWLWHKENSDLRYCITNECLSITTALHSHFFFSEDFFRAWLRTGNTCSTDRALTSTSCIILIEDHHNFTWRPSTGLYCGMLVVVTSNMIQRLMVCTAQSFVWFFSFHLLTLHFSYRHM